MILHIVAPEGRELAISNKIAKRLSRISDKYQLSCDKAGGLRYNKGFVLLNIESEERSKVLELLKLSNVLAVKEITESELQSPFYQPITKKEDENPSNTIEEGKSYLIKKGPFESMSIIVDELLPESVKGKVNIFGRETTISVEISALGERVI